jgi:ABC-2 type transport system permease protein
VRTKAFLLYFSRPLARFEYVLGKMAVVWVYMLLISAAPALVLYVLGVLLSPDLSVVLSTWDLPLRILAATAVLMIPMAAVSLALSSLTSETRYATFGWFAFWAIGWATYLVLTTNLPASAGPQRWNLLSLYHTLGTVQYWVFGLKYELADRLLPFVSEVGLLPSPSQVEVWPAAVEMIVITVVALAILFRRVSSPMRI